jgi:hypothetical protein
MFSASSHLVGLAAGVFPPRRHRSASPCLLASLRPCLQIIRDTVPLNFHRKPLKTNESTPRQPGQFSSTGFSRITNHQSRITGFGSQITPTNRHTCQSKIRRNPLKTKKSDTRKVTHFFEHPTRLLILSEQREPKGESPTRVAILSEQREPKGVRSEWTTAPRTIDLRRSTDRSVCATEDRTPSLIPCLSASLLPGFRYDVRQPDGRG